MSQIDMGVVKKSGYSVMVVNNSWQLAPWADVLYAGDLEWWQRYGKDARSFQGEKWTRCHIAARRYNINHIHRLRGFGLCRIPGHVNSGGNSGYQAVNLCYHLGAKKIILLGFDMHRQNGGHWHGEHEGMLSAPNKHIIKWRQNFEALAADLKSQGCNVINATPGTALTCFPRMTLEDALC